MLGVTDIFSSAGCAKPPPNFAILRIRRRGSALIAKLGLVTSLGSHITGGLVSLGYVSV